jgi:hypothetical protein
MIVHISKCDSRPCAKRSKPNVTKADLFLMQVVTGFWWEAGQE